LYNVSGCIVHKLQSSCAKLVIVGETCYMHITCTSFIHHFFKSTIRYVGPICES